MVDAKTEKQKVQEITEKLEQGIKELFESEKYKTYLNTMSKFHNYSFNNTMLIAMQKPDATLVVGFKAWQKNFDRHVKKGEKGIRILAPAPYKIKEEQEDGNWDLEFDNVEGRCSVEKWILYDLLKKKWERMGLGDYSKQIVNTLYGNPLRRAWIELNYIYFYIIREIEKMSFKLFVTEAESFLSKEEDIRQQMSGVNLCSLRLSDMGNTTLGVTAPPYDEIAQEAFSVWELFEGKYR